MRFGVGVFATQDDVNPVTLAQAVEERGFESLWLPDIIQIDATASPDAAEWHAAFPDRDERLLRKKGYWHADDPFIALTAAAVVTSRLQIATIAQIAERDPVVTAIVIATVDRISGGRLLLAVHSHAPGTQKHWAALRERLLAMRQIWTNENAEFHGDFVTFGPIRSYPKPIQQPYPPILLDGDGSEAFRHVIDFCDGWISDRSYSPPVFATKIARLRARAVAAGRDPRALSVTIFTGDPARGHIEALAEAGADRVVFRVGAGEITQLLPRLDTYAALIR